MEFQGIMVPENARILGMACVCLGRVSKQAVIDIDNRQGLCISCKNTVKTSKLLFLFPPTSFTCIYVREEFQSFGVNLNFLNCTFKNLKSLSELEISVKERDVNVDLVLKLKSLRNLMKTFTFSCNNIDEALSNEEYSYYSCLKIECSVLLGALRHIFRAEEVVLEITETGCTFSSLSDSFLSKAALSSTVEIGRNDFQEFKLDQNTTIVFSVREVKPFVSVLENAGEFSVFIQFSRASMPLSFTNVIESSTIELGASFKGVLTVATRALGDRTVLATVPRKEKEMHARDNATIGLQNISIIPEDCLEEDKSDDRNGLISKSQHTQPCETTEPALEPEMEHEDNDFFALDNESFCPVVLRHKRRR